MYGADFLFGDFTVDPIGKIVPNYEYRRYPSKNKKNFKVVFLIKNTQRSYYAVLQKPN